MRRVKEALETHDWADSSAANADADADDDDDALERELFGLEAEESGFNLEVNQLQREMLGLSLAIGRGGSDSRFDDEDGDGNEGNKLDDGPVDEDQVESMEALMLRMKSIRGMSSGTVLSITKYTFQKGHSLC